MGVDISKSMDQWGLEPSSSSSYDTQRVKRIRESERGETCEAVWATLGYKAGF